MFLIFRKFTRQNILIFGIPLMCLLTIAFVIKCTDVAPNFRLSIVSWEEKDNISCHLSDLDNALRLGEGPLFTPSTKSIFFHETSCSGGLDTRQACSVESAARTHPDWEVHVLFNAPVKKSMLERGSLSLLRKLKNVRLHRIHTSKYAKGTPLETMLSDGLLNETQWPVEHTADVLRYLSLYKWGGIYLDLDVIVVKRLDTLATNYAARESSENVAAGVMAFSGDDVGRSVAEAAIMDIKNNYDPYKWSHNSVGVIKRVLEARCNSNKLLEWNVETCKGFEVYPPEMFYPVPYWDNKVYFTSGDLEQRTKVAFTHHVWNKLTHAYPVPNDSPYAKMAKRVCPSVYKAFPDDFRLHPK